MEEYSANTINSNNIVLENNAKRSNTIDFVKGFLIVVVVVGHILPGTLEESFARWIIYSFHMPLFMTISGYLVNREKLYEISWGKFILKYLRRIIIPWIIAVLFFYGIGCNGAHSLKALLSAFITPYYHLWFVIAYCLFMALTKLMCVWGGYWLLTISGILGVLLKYLDICDKTFGLRIFEIVQHIARPYLFFFFFLGYMLRNGEVANGVENSKNTLHFWLCKKETQITMGIVLIVSIAIEIAIFFNTNHVVEAVNCYLLNICIAVIVVQLFNSGREIKNRGLEYIGKNSLPIYLWHVVGILAVKQYFGNEFGMLYYTMNVLMFILFLLAIYGLNKISFVRKYVFGSRK